MSSARRRWRARSTAWTWRTAATTSLRRTSPPSWPSPTSWRESAPSSCCRCVSWCASGASPAASTHTGTSLTTYRSSSKGGGGGGGGGRGDGREGEKGLVETCATNCRGYEKGSSGTLQVKYCERRHTANTQQSILGELEPLVTWRTDGRETPSSEATASVYATYADPSGERERERRKTKLFVTKLRVNRPQRWIWSF